MELLSTQKEMNLLKEFYNLALINETIQVYSDFFETNLKEEEFYYILSFKQVNFDYDLDVLVDEFLNYLLSLEYEHKGKNNLGVDVS